VVPARVIDTTEHYEPAMQGGEPPDGQWLGFAGPDLVRLADGEFRVIEDNLLTPSRFAYAAAARDAVLAALDAPPVTAPRSFADLPLLLAGALPAASPVADEPYLVVLADDPDDPAHWGHAYAPRPLGVPLSCTWPGSWEKRSST